MNDASASPVHDHGTRVARFQGRERQLGPLPCGSGMEVG